MNSVPLISIVVNCYNSDKYLKIALNSAFSQTYRNWELIFWDNQSTDESAAIVNSYDDNRVKYFYAPVHTPLGEARNLAIEKAQGTWIAFLDCDDIWHKDKLQFAFEEWNNSEYKDNVALIYSKTVYINENCKPFKYFEEYYTGEIHDLLLKKGDFVFISSAIFRKDILDRVGKINENLHYAEDYDVLLKVTKDHHAICVNEFHTFYRVHNENLTSRKVYEYDVENFEFLNNYAKENNLSLSLKGSIFLENSKRMTASIYKLAYKKDFLNLAKIISSYPQYVILSPFYILYFLLNKLKFLVK